jgi:hypothetical protein
MENKTMGDENEQGETDFSKFEGEVQGDEQAPASEQENSESEEKDEEQETDTSSEEETGDDDAREEDTPPKKTQTPSDRIRELNKRLRQSERLRQADKDHFEQRLSNIEKIGLSNGSGSDSSSDIGNAPDPADTDKYPLGHLDDRYIEDKLEWLSTKKAAERADAVLQRQQENERNAAVQQEQAALLDKVDDLATRGSEMFDDFQETVVEAGMRGDYPLQQATFEAAFEADHGAQILHELSQNRKEAVRVANLSIYQQVKFVEARNAEIAAKGKTARIPKAGDPAPSVRGSGARKTISPATDSFEEFERLANASKN